ncbi:uncharacterized protein EV154DRAFT_484589 [Mucor mucedo]|uniref:uncharacterized protein n=1 Tax=Mucor mucedo TaxID=29922 RepID=UPI00221EF0CD|nr:uncharacterized protein EV154DRAFT_484589 [Mucor mucedo]KAI7887942.1 hypothetical protein EV154DRAFT_484589 [Mucor mucedo]
MKTYEAHICHIEVPQLSELRPTFPPEYCDTGHTQFKNKCYCYCYSHLIMAFLYGIITFEYYLDKSTHNRHQLICDKCLNNVYMKTRFYLFNKAVLNFCKFDNFLVFIYKSSPISRKSQLLILVNNLLMISVP